MDQHSLQLTDNSILDILGKSEFVSDFYIYHCRVCFQTLVISKRQLSGKQVDTILKEKCPQCVLPLSENLSCRSVKAPFDTPFWKHPQIDFRPLHPEPLHPVQFTPAYSLFGLSSQIGFVDKLIGGLKSETVALIKGSEIPTLIAERYCVKAQLPEHLGGLDGRSLFIDGGNSFDVYLFTSIAREYGLDFDSALNRIIISRAFTPYELLQLVSKDIDEVFEVYCPQLLVVSDIFHLFTQDVEKDEAERILHKIGYTIQKISQLRRVPIVITSASRADHLECFFRDFCTIVAEFREEEHRIMSILLRHPSREPVEIVQELSNDTYNQMLLSPLRAMPHG